MQKEGACFKDMEGAFVFDSYIDGILVLKKHQLGKI